MSNITTILRKELNLIGKDLVKSIKNELANQRHIATGKLANTTNHKVNVSQTEGNLLISSKAKYWRAVNDGTKPHTPPFEDIMQWMDDKGIAYANEAEKKQIANAIIRRIEIEGTPTKGSFARTGATFRRGYLNRSVGSKKQSITRRLQKVIGDQIKVEFNKVIKKANQDG